MNKLLSLAVLMTAVASLTACNSSLASAVTSQLPSGVQNAVNAATGKLSGTIYAPSTQVAIVAQGGGNIVAQGGGNAEGGYSALSLRSDEAGVANAKVVATPSSGDSITGQTDGTGNFALNATASTTYKVVATFTGKDDDTITVSGFAQVDPIAPLKLGVGHNMVASKLLASGITNPDYTAFKAAVASMESDIQSVAAAPTPTDQASAAAAFDSNASAGTKSLVAAIKNQ